MQHDRVPNALVEDLARRLQGTHPITLDWGPGFSDRFSTDEAAKIWRRFEPLEQMLRSDEEQFEPAFQSGPMQHYFNQMPATYTTIDFIASWR